VPRATVVLYREGDKVPLLDWFDGLSVRARAKCLVRLERLAELGHQLRRPEADYLRDDIYELRIKHDGINYRILYFFHGRDVVVISHGISKQRRDVPNAEIEIAITRKRAFVQDPRAHTYEA
jgi:phage-related protein